MRIITGIIACHGEFFFAAHTLSCDIKKYLIKKTTIMRKHTIVLIIALIATSAIGAGCSFIGFAAGSALDNKKTKTVGAWELMQLPKDTRVTVYCSKREPVEGRFIGGSKANPATDPEFNTILIRKSGKRIASIPVADVDRVLVHGKHSAKRTGFLVGLGLDLATIAILATADMYSSWDFGSGASGTSSCPLIYSYDGSSYQPDAEIFAGAIFKAAEKPDWDNLNFLKESEGRYRLKMANVFDETQQVDFVHLLVIDHPAGTQVVASQAGQLFTLSDLQTPRSAQDFAGADVKASVRKTDGAFWLSNPFGRNLQDPSELRDGIVLEFERSATASSAALLLNVQNTLWASDIQKKLLALPGAELPEWYKTLNSSVDARMELMRMMVREGLLRVYVWDDAQSLWRPAGHVWEIGTALAKDVVVDLDLIGLHSNTLKVKLECPPGAWIVNSAQLDFSYSTVPQMDQTLMPQKAVDQNGRDLLPLLQKADNRYYEMPATLDEAWLEFSAPPLKSGMERSFIVKSGGYYTIHMPADTPPQMERLRTLLKEPGAFTRFALESLYRETGEATKNLPALQ